MFFSLVIVGVCVGLGVEGQGYYGGYRRFRGYGGSRGYASYGENRGVSRKQPGNLNLRRPVSLQSSGLTLPRNLALTPPTKAASTETPSLPRKSSTIPQQTNASSRRSSQLLNQTPQQEIQMSNPYLTIDTDKFAVIAAVPEVKIPKQNARISSARVPKNITPGQEASILIPNRFSPVPAVPTVTSDVDHSDSVQVEDVANTVEEVRVEVLTEPTTVYKESNFLAPSRERKQFKRCHGKCVQKFCLPIEDLGVFDKCTEKCKGICTT